MCDQTAPSQNLGSRSKVGSPPASLTLSEYYSALPFALRCAAACSPARPTCCASRYLPPRKTGLQEKKEIGARSWKLSVDRFAWEESTAVAPAIDRYKKGSGMYARTFSKGTASSPCRQRGHG